MEMRPIKVVAERRSGAQFPQSMVSMPLSYRILRLGSRSIFGRSTVNKPTNVAADLDTPSSLTAEGIHAIAASLNVLLADVFALYLKTKNFHWHMSGPHFRDYHLMLDEQADPIFEITDQSPNGCARSAAYDPLDRRDLQSTIVDNDDEFVTPGTCCEAREDNKNWPTACDRHTN